MLAAAGVPDEAARDRFAHGILLGGSEGLQQQAAASEILRGFGYVNPQRDVQSYYPELFEAPR